MKNLEGTWSSHWKNSNWLIRKITRAWQGDIDYKRILGESLWEILLGYYNVKPLVDQQDIWIILYASPYTIPKFNPWTFHQVYEKWPVEDIKR